MTRPGLPLRSGPAWANEVVVTVETRETASAFLALGMAEVALIEEDSRGSFIVRGADHCGSSNGPNNGQ